MKAIILFLIPMYAYSANITIEKPCSQETIEFSVSPQNSSLGQIMIEILDYNRIEYQGNTQGINSLLGTAVGLESYEVLSDERMRVYGWCYSVNGQNIEKLMSNYFPTKSDNIRWFYAYAEIIKNDWISYCTPVSLDLPVCH